MDSIVVYLISLVAVGVIGYMLVKKMDITISLFMIGIVLCFCALAMGKGIAFKGFSSTGVQWLDPFKLVGDQFVSTLVSAGFIILILGGYTGYMSAIGANEVTVHVLAKPLKHVKSAYVLVPLTFLLGNLLSLVVPSASNLAIILLATLYPVLRASGMSTLTTAAVIATTATIMPTPLGSDNVAIADALAKTTQFAGLTVTEYVFKYHAIVSIPTLFVIAIAHYFWQKYMDKKYGASIHEDIETKSVTEFQGGKVARTVYAILPLLPIIMLLIVFALGNIGIKVNLSVALASILSFVIAIFCELIRTHDGQATLKKTEFFFKGMGNAMPIVALTAAASVFVVGLMSIGLISQLQSAMTGIQGNGMGFVLPLILVGLTALIVLLSGSGTSLFFAMVPLMVPLAAAAGINVLAVSIPMGLAGNLLRAVSPVSSVVMIVAGTCKINPIELVRRTSIPMIVGVVVMFILSCIVFLPMGA